MSFTIYVRMKKSGKGMCKELAPTPFEVGQRPETLGELLTALTELGVKDYNARKDEGQILPFLTREEIAGQALSGKESFGITGELQIPRRLWRIRFSVLRTGFTVCSPGRKN